jgi:DNA-binding transcriptional LysR family regulator
MQMTVDGMGIATLPKAAVLDEIASGNLIEVEHSWVPQSLDIFARYDAEKSPLSVVKVAEIAGDVAANFRKQHSQPK